MKRVGSPHCLIILIISLLYVNLTFDNFYGSGSTISPNLKRFIETYGTLV
jgi:hypothetical protein